MTDREIFLQLMRKQVGTNIAITGALIELWPVAKNEKFLAQLRKIQDSTAELMQMLEDAE